jgi:hypothetical protein
VAGRENARRGRLFCGSAVQPGVDPLLARSRKKIANPPRAASKAQARAAAGGIVILSLRLTPPNADVGTSRAHATFLLCNFSTRVMIIHGFVIAVVILQYCARGTGCRQCRVSYQPALATTLGWFARATPIVTAGLDP